MPDSSIPSDTTMHSENEAHSEDEASASPSREELEERVRELRAEVARLKVQQSQSTPDSWMQRNASLVLALGTALGAATGYGLSKAFAPAPPLPLSERARQEVQRLFDQAMDVASETGRSVGQQAATMSAEARKRAQETGRQLAEETGRRLAEDADAFRDATRTRTREWSQQAADELADIEESVEKSARETADAVRASVPSDSTSIGRTVGSVALLAAGSYLAAKARDWM